MNRETRRRTRWTIAPDGRIVRTVVRTCGNRKLGRHTVTTTRDRASCPRDCGLWSECYATNPTQNGGSIFDNVTTAPDDGPDLVRAIMRPSMRAVRYNVAGDFLTADGTAVDTAYIAATNDGADAAHARGIPVWSYTHAWRPSPDRPHIEPGMMRYTCRASCETVEDVRDAHARGWTACIVVDTPADPIIGQRIDEQPVILCPASPKGSPITCETCAGGRALCATGRGVVAFPRHGLASERAAREA